MKHATIVYGEPDFEGFVYREFTNASAEHGAVKIAFKTYGPSLEIKMTVEQARALAAELARAARLANQSHANLPHMVLRG